MVEAVSNDLRGSTDSAAADVDVVLGAAARDGRRPAALHQSGRHGTGDLHARRIVERSRRARWASTPSAAFRCPDIPTSASPCSRIPGTCRRTSRPMVLRAQPGGHGSHRAILVQAVPQEIPRARFPAGRRADGEAGELGRSHRPRWRRARTCSTASFTSTATCGARTTSSLPTCASRPKRRSCGTARSCTGARRRPTSPTCAITSTTARRWTSRCTWASIFPT